MAAALLLAAMIHTDVVMDLQMGWWFTAAAASFDFHLLWIVPLPELLRRKVSYSFAPANLLLARLRALGFFPL